MGIVFAGQSKLNTCQALSYVAPIFAILEDIQNLLGDEYMAMLEYR